MTFPSNHDDHLELSRRPNLYGFEWEEQAVKKLKFDQVESAIKSAVGDLKRHDRRPQNSI